MIISKPKFKSKNNRTVSKKKSHCMQANRARKILHGYPVKPHSLSNLQIDEYLNQDKLICLICGKSYKSIGKLHLRVHGIDQQIYREMYDLPFTKPLDSKETRDKKRGNMDKLIQDGKLEPIRKGQNLDRAKSKQRMSGYKKRKIIEQGNKNIPMLEKFRKNKLENKRQNEP